MPIHFSFSARYRGDMDTRRKPERRCLAPGCLTTLSTYNMDFLCFAHADEVTRARFERVSSPRIPQANIRYRHTTESSNDGSAMSR